MWRLAALVAVLCVCLAAPRFARCADEQVLPVFSTELTGEDLQFLHGAAELGLMQLKFNEIARARSGNYAITTFCQMLTRDLIDRSLDLRLLAGTKGVTMEPELNESQKRMIAKLGKLYGNEFDRTFMSRIIGAQLNAIAEFEKAAKGAADPEVKEFATKSLPALRENLFLATKITGEAYRARTKPLLRNPGLAPLPATR
jgi:putative membrane protein